MGGGDSQLAQDELIEEKHSELVGLEGKFILDSGFGDHVNPVQVENLLYAWEKYSRLKHGYLLGPRKELAHLHILALGDYFNGKIDFMKMHAVITGKLPGYMKIGCPEDQKRLNGYIEECQQRRY